MGKKVLSLCMALALCLSLLPATALASVEGVPDTLLVGGTNVIGGGYWTTNSTTGELTQSSESESWNVRYDTSNNTLTLKNADITGAASEATPSQSVGIYAFSSSEDVALEIALQGENKITSTGPGIWVYSSSTNTVAASLTISGSVNDSLIASGFSDGILVQSNNGDAALTIQNAKVEATVTSTVGNGVNVRSSQSSTASLTVNGGSLTASGAPGILYDSSGSGSVPEMALTISNSALVDARDGGIQAGGGDSADNVTPASGSTGIVFNGKDGTVYGNVTLQENLTIGEGESLTIPEGASLNTNDKLTVDGGTLTGDVTGTVNYKVTGVSLSPDTLTLKVGESKTLTPTITPTIATNQDVTWESSNTNVATVNNGTVTALSTGTATITVKTEDGEFTDTCTVTVNAADYVPVESVSLNKTSTTLTVGDTETLTATVQPDGASNRTVTWTSSNPSVATVDASGTVTAVSEGTANITVTTEDGNFTATCEVTVNPVEYTVTVLTDGSGRASASPSTAAAGEPVTLTATPANGWRFERWEVVSGGVTIENNSFTMPAENVTVRAVFSRVINIPDTYGITVSATDGGSARTSLSNASAGTAITVTATPDEGYELVYITVDGERITGTTFTMPAHDVTVSVYFREIASLPFTDVASGAWYYDAVSYVYLNGLMDGISDTLFDPDAPMTRAMVWAILARIDGETVTGANWVETARAWAVANGVSDGENADSPVTREQLAAMLWRFAGESASTYSIAAYTDAASVSGWAATAMRWSIDTGVITGVTSTTLAPQSTASRAHCAAMLMRFCELPV